MANLRDIRRRIKSVKNTAQITKAMQMVAASKMRKAQLAALSGRDYAQLLNRVIVSVRDAVEHSLHPLLHQTLHLVQHQIHLVEKAVRLPN